MKNIFIISLLVFASLFHASADKPLKDSPLNPGQGFKFNGWLGIEAGFGPNIQSGDLMVRCPSCLFDNGRGTGYFIGLNYDHYFVPFMSFGIMLSYEDYSILTQYRELTSRNFINESTDQSVLLNLELQQTAEMNYQFIGATPFVRYRPIEEFSVRAGVMMAFGEPRLTHTETVSNPVQQIQGETYIIEKQEANDNLENDEVPDGASGRSMLGFISMNGHFWLRYDLALTLGLQWRQQFSSFEFNDSDFTIMAPRFSLGLEYMFYRKK